MGEIINPTENLLGLASSFTSFDLIDFCKDDDAGKSAGYNPVVHLYVLLTRLSSDIEKEKDEMGLCL